VLCCGLIALLLGSLGFSFAGPSDPTANGKPRSFFTIYRKSVIAISAAVILLMGVAVTFSAAVGSQSAEIVFRHLCIFSEQKVLAIKSK